MWRWDRLLGLKNYSSSPKALTWERLKIDRERIIRDKPKYLFQVRWWEESERIWSWSCGYFVIVTWFCFFLKSIKAIRVEIVPQVGIFMESLKVPLWTVLMSLCCRWTMLIVGQDSELGSWKSLCWGFVEIDLNWLTWKKVSWRVWFRSSFLIRRRRRWSMHLRIRLSIAICDRHSGALIWLWLVIADGILVLLFITTCKVQAVKLHWPWQSQWVIRWSCNLNGRWTAIGMVWNNSKATEAI